MQYDTHEIKSSPELEIACEECKGAGGKHAEDGWIPCNKCDGAGVLISDFGKELLEFLQRKLTIGSHS